MRTSNSSSFCLCVFVIKQTVPVCADKNLDIDWCQGEFPSMHQRIEGELVELLSQDLQASMNPHKKMFP